MTEGRDVCSVLAPADWAPADWAPADRALAAAAARAPTAAVASALLLSIARLLSTARGGGVDEAHHRLDASLAGDRHEVGALDEERRIGRAAGHPTEANEI